MDTKVIIHSSTNDNKNISVTWCADKTFNIDEIAKRVVPEGFKYKIINHSDLPTSDTFQSTWEYDFGKSFDGIGMNNLEWEKYIYNSKIKD